MGGYKETGFDDMFKDSEKKFLKQKYYSLGLTKKQATQRLQVLSSAVIVPLINSP